MLTLSRKIRGVINDLLPSVTDVSELDLSWISRCASLSDMDDLETSTCGLKASGSPSSSLAATGIAKGRR